MRPHAWIVVGITAFLRRLALGTAKNVVGFAYHSFTQAYLSIYSAVLDGVNDETRHDDADNGLYGIDSEQAQESIVDRLKRSKCFGVPRIVLSFGARVDSKQNRLYDDEHKKQRLGGRVNENVAQLHSQLAVGREDA